MAGTTRLESRVGHRLAASTTAAPRRSRGSRPDIGFFPHAEGTRGQRVLLEFAALERRRGRMAHAAGGWRATWRCGACLPPRIALKQRLGSRARGAPCLVCSPLLHNPGCWRVNLRPAAYQQLEGLPITSNSALYRARPGPARSLSVRSLCPPPRLAAQRQLERALRAPARGVNLDAVAHCGAAMAWRCDADDLTDEGDERLVPRCNAVARDCRVACSRVYAAASGGGIAATQPPPQCRAAVPAPPERPRRDFSQLPCYIGHLASTREFSISDRLNRTLI